MEEHFDVIGASEWSRAAMFDLTDLRGKQRLCEFQRGGVRLPDLLVSLRIYLQQCK